jgi:hypothetical protein
MHIEGTRFRAFEGRQRRYAFWLLRKFVRIGAGLRGEAPEPPFAISLAERQVLALTQFVITSTNVHAISKDQGIAFGHAEQAAPRAGIQGWRTAKGLRRRQP